jgi:hypothetical protein
MGRLKSGRAPDDLSVFPDFSFPDFQVLIFISGLQSRWRCNALCYQDFVRLATLAKIVRYVGIILCSLNTVKYQLAHDTEKSCSRVQPVPVLMIQLQPKSAWPD